MSQIGKLSCLSLELSANDIRVQGCVAFSGALHQFIPLNLGKRRLIDRQRLFDAKDVERRHVPTVRTLLER